MTDRSARYLVAISVLVVSLAVFFRVPFLPTIGIDIGMTDTQLAGITTVFAIGRLIDLPAGRLADRFHPYGVMGVGLLVAACGCVALGLAQQMLLVYVGAFLLGVASGVSNTSGLRFFSTVSAPEKRAASVSIYSSVLLVGQASGPPLAAVLGSLGSWRSAHVLASAMLLAVAIVLLVQLRFNDTSGQSSVARPSGLPRSEAKRRGSLALWILYLIPLLMFGAFGIAIHTLVPIIGHDIGLGATAIGVALGVGGAFRLVAIISGGQVADRISRKAALVPAIVVSSVGVGFLAFASSYPTWLVAIILVSMGSIAISTSATLIADLSPPEAVGRALARWRFAGDIGLVSVPILLGATFDHHGAVWALLPLAVVLGGLAVAVVTVIPRTRPSTRATTNQS